MDALAQPIVRATEIMVASLLANGKILACGNGGSAADSQHFAAELLNRFERERPGLAAMALTTDTSTLTSIANDYDYEPGVLQAGARARPAAATCCSRSPPAATRPTSLAAIRAAHERDMRVVALTGKGGGEIGKHLAPGDVHICVPHAVTARIQEVHLLTLHCLCDGIDCLLLGTE